ncbi:MAG: hypothetical protein WDM80_13850 [Limisphaerales bacterium]
MDGRPLMLLYRCEAPPSANSTPESRAAVASFLKSFKGLHPQYDGFPQPFVSDDDFAALLVRDLDQLARRIIANKASKQIKNGRELAELVGSVHKWLGTFEDMFGNQQEDQERERDRLFPIYFRKLSGASGSPAISTTDLLPGKNKSMLDLFNDQDGRMLMVGERGTGKTFAMLRLMQDLADRANIRPGEPVPVFFNLSSWSETYHESTRPPALLVRAFQWLFPQPEKSSKTLFQWLEDQMVRNYSMQRMAARRLLGENHVILCLDGLDELGTGGTGDKEVTDKASCALRDACVKAINGTLRNQSVRMILCCREETYHELTVKPAMGAPLQTQTLTSEEVIADLEHWDNLEGLKDAMSQSAFLKDRARVALFLSMMRIAYEGMSAALILRAVELAKKSPVDWERHLMDHYVDRCMKLAPPKSQALNSNLVPDCLSWIARQPDNDFLLDDLQPSVLRNDGTSEGEKLWKYYRRLSITILAISLMLVESLPAAGSTAVEWGFHDGLGAGIWQGLKMLLVSFCILTPLYLLAFSARGSLLLGFSFGLAWALDSAACDYLGAPREGGGHLGSWQEVTSLFLVSLPCAFIVFTLVGACTIFGRLAEHKDRYKNKAGIEWHEILPVEPLYWRWFNEKSIWRGGWIGLVIGPLILFIGWIGGQMERAMVAAPINTLLVCVFSGLSGSGLARVSIEPNQGIRRTLRHALLMTGLFVTCSCLTWSGVYFYYHGLERGLVGFVIGLTLAFSFFIFGGIPVIRQFCLGSILHQQGKLPTWYCWPPWKATVEFLDDLVRYKLLRRSAGGYMFRHQSLREYYRTLHDHIRT